MAKEDQSFEDAFNELAGGQPQQDDEPQVAQPAELDAEPLATVEQPADAAPADQPADEPAPVEAKVEDAKAPPKRRRLHDMLDFVPEAEREAYREMIGEVLGTMHTLKSDSGRVAAMQRLYEEAKAREAEMQSRLAELEARAKAATTQAERSQVAQEAQAIADEKDELDEEFPELSKSVNLRIERMLKKALPAQEAPAKEAPQQQPTEQPKADEAEVTALQQEFSRLGEKHPDWQEAVQTEAFQVWFQRQSPAMQALYGSKSADDAILLLDQFKHAVAQARAREQQAKQAESRKRLEQNVGIKGAPAKATAVPDDFESAFNYFAAKG